MEQTLKATSSKFLPILFVFSFIIITACEKEETLPPVTVIDECENTNYTYTDDIKEIMDQSCANSGCHDGSNNLRPFNTYQGVYDIRNDIRNAILTDFANVPLQARGRLSEAEEEKILCWVKSGAPE